MAKNKLKIMAVLTTSILVMNTTAFASTVLTTSSDKTNTFEFTEVNKLYSLDESDELVAENNKLALYVNKDDLSIKIYDKEIDFIYSSNDCESENLNQNWENYLNSPVTINTLSTNLKTQQETLFDSLDSTFKYEKINNGFRGDLSFGKSKISLSYSVVLTDDGIEIEILNDSIVENQTEKIVSEQQQEVEDVNLEELTVIERAKVSAAAKLEPFDLQSIQIYPFLGAVKTGSQNGYTFISEGSGALIRYDEYYPKASSPYELYFYGKDSALPDSSSNDYLVMSNTYGIFPIYGMVHGVNQTGFLNIIESGAEEARLLSYPAGLFTDYYFTTVEYMYNNKFSQKLSSTQNITSSLDERKNFDIKEKYVFVQGDEANYVGLAHTYKDYLNKNGMLNNYDIEEIPLSLDLYMGGRKKGMFKDTFVPFTTTDEIVEMYDYFKGEGINNVLFNTYNGIIKSDFTGKFSDNSKINNKIEGDYSFEEANAHISEGGGQLFIVSYINRTYGKLNLNKFVQRLYDKSYYQYKFDGLVFNFLNIAGIDKLTKEVTKLIDNNDITGIYVTANDGYTSYGKDKVETRAEIMSTIVEKNKAYSDKDITIAAEVPSNNHTSYTDYAIYVSPETTLYEYVTDTVPFYQIVLSGNIPMVSVNLNQYGYDKDYILKLIEYNTYPQYSLMYADYDEISNTQEASRAYIPSTFNLIKTDCVAVYNEINTVLSEVINEEIVNHEVVDKDVIAVTYSNGKTIVINYRNNDYNYRGVNVGKKGCVVIE